LQMELRRCGYSIMYYAHPTMNLNI
jgi:hypothetical protein